MKRSYYNSLGEFYNSIGNHRKNHSYDYHANSSRPDFVGLPLATVLESRFSYQPGVEQLRKYAEAEVAKDTRVKYYNSFDGYDIDVDRMYENMDFLLDCRRQRNRPKAIDIYINVAENCHVEYSQMLHKTYATLKLTDHLESLGIRVGVFCVMAVDPRSANHRLLETEYVEICVKHPADSVNLGALCTSISPWFFRQWGFMWIVGRYPSLAGTIGQAIAIPRSEIRPGTIVIDNGQCLSETSANNLIESINLN